VLDRCIAAAEAEDQIILRMRFWNARRVPDIARALQIDQRKVYKKIERQLLKMKAALHAAGLSREDVDEILARNDQEIPMQSGENRPAGPSHRLARGSGTARAE